MEHERMGTGRPIDGLRETFGRRRAGTNRSLRLIAALSYSGVAFLLAYFVYFPTIGSALLTNLLLVLAVAITVVSLIAGAFLLKKKADIWYLLPQALALTFIARAIPNLRLAYPPLHDPYYYFSATMNILDYGTLTEHLSYWYETVDVFLHWPIIHLLSANLVYLTGLTPDFMLRFQEPLLGMVFFLAAFSLANVITHNYSFSFIAALLASFSETIVFYQSEYHPQGLAIILFILIIYLFFKYLSFPKRIAPVAGLIVLVGTAFMLSHYFTPLFISLIFVEYIIFLAAIPALKYLKGWSGKWAGFIKNAGFDNRICIILILLPLAYEFVYYNFFLCEAIKMMGFGGHAAALVPSSVATTAIPLITSILSLFKWILLILSIISIAYIIWARLDGFFRLVILVISLLIAGAVGFLSHTAPTDRIIAFYSTFAAVLASVVILKLRGWSPGWMNKNLGMVLATAIVAMLVVGAFLNSQTPSYYFKDAPVNMYYWYSDDLSSMGVYQNTGDWISLYTPAKSYFMTEFDTRILPYYYGNRSSTNMQIFDPSDPYSANFTVLNPRIPYSGDYGMLDKKQFIGTHGLTYNNGVLDVVSR